MSVNLNSLFDGNVNDPVQQNNIIPTSKEAQANPYRAKEREVFEREEIAKTYKRQQEAIRKSQELQAKIIKSINEGAAADDILVLALDCVAAATGNELFSKIAKEKLNK